MRVARTRFYCAIADRRLFTLEHEYLLNHAGRLRSERLVVRRDFVGRDGELRSILHDCRFQHARPEPARRYEDAGTQPTALKAVLPPVDLKGLGLVNRFP